MGTLSRISLTLALSFIVSAICTGIWLFYWGEGFFSLTRPTVADVLIVEDWIGSDGIRAAAQEFKRGGYKYVVATGAVPVESVEHDRSSYAEMARQELAESGISTERIIVASPGEIEHERTFKSAVVAWQAIQRRGVRPVGINVFTRGPHARRSRLVYEKVYGPDVPVGVIAFIPAGYSAKPWWRSSERRKCLLKELVGYPFEVLLNSGRFSNSPAIENSELGHGVISQLSYQLVGRPGTENLASSSRE